MRTAQTPNVGGDMPTKERMDRLEGKVDALFALIASMRDELHGGRSAAPLPRMTTKQHAALQMLLRGASNAEIAERFGVTLNTAKVYVRSLFPKAGGSTRTKVVLAFKDAFDATPESDYVIISGGLPKNWDATYVHPDPYAPLYQGHDHGTDTRTTEG